jgi:hypothetical protein
MSNYQDIRNLESMLFSEAVVGNVDDLTELAVGLARHFEFNVNYEQIEWIVEGVKAQADDYWNDALDAIDETL